MTNIDRCHTTETLLVRLSIICYIPIVPRGMEPMVGLCDTCHLCRIVAFWTQRGGQATLFPFSFRGPTPRTECTSPTLNHVGTHLSEHRLPVQPTGSSLRAQIVSVTAPWILLRRFDRPGTDWIELHIPAQCPSVPFLLDQNGFETTLGQRPGAPMPVG